MKERNKFLATSVTENAPNTQEKNAERVSGTESMKNLNRIISSSIILILATLIAMVGSSYALFAVKDTVVTATSSGGVKVASAFTAYETYSAVQLDPQAEEYDDVDEDGVKYVLEKQDEGEFISGQECAQILAQGETFSVINITPGDKVSLTISVSNVGPTAFNYCIVADVMEGEELASGFDFDFDGTEVKHRQGEALKHFISEWYQPLIRGGETALNVSLYLPIAQGNYYQDRTCKIKISILSIQAKEGELPSSVAQTVFVPVDNI